MDTFEQVAVIVSAFVFVAVMFLLLGVHLGRAQAAQGEQEESCDGLIRLTEKSIDALVKTNSQAMNMASVIPDEQLSRINAEAIHEAATTGRSPIDARRGNERDAAGGYGVVDGVAHYMDETEGPAGVV
ncbi:MAG: hypothetical protein ACX94C_11715 [Phycisphaerales bacterium]